MANRSVGKAARIGRLRIPKGVATAQRQSPWRFPHGGRRSGRGVQAHYVPLVHGVVRVYAGLPIGLVSLRQRLGVRSIHDLRGS